MLEAQKRCFCYCAAVVRNFESRILTCNFNYRKIKRAISQILLCLLGHWPHSAAIYIIVLLSNVGTVNMYT